MRSAIIHNLPDWRVTSFGNGLSYELVHKPSAMAVSFLSDYDAERFRDQLENLTEGMPALDYADALAIIWSDYSEIAEPLVEVQE